MPTTRHLRVLRALYLSPCLAHVIGDAYLCASVLLEQGYRLNVVGEARPARREGGGGSGDQRVNGGERRMGEEVR